MISNDDSVNDSVNELAENTPRGGEAVAPANKGSLAMPMPLSGRTLSITLAMTALFALFWPTLASMVAIWWRSETFAHGFLVFPISAYLIWRMRGELSRLNYHTSFWAVGALIILGFVWLLARVADVLVVQQLAFVVMIPATVWLLLGWPAVKQMAFPFGFLVFAVPVGEGLIPPMMQFTADFTVQALRSTGIPVYVEGTFFTIPSGRWSVVEGCSGVRYLIASVTLGALYAYLSYYTLWRRVLFVFLAIIVPIIANGLRAYMIVMIAHLSDMKLALGVDHLIYGWVFFGLVMFLLFWLGTLWREKESREAELEAPGVSVTTGDRENMRRVVAASLLGLLTVAVWPAWAAWLQSDSGSGSGAAIRLASPAGSKGWLETGEPFAEWKPRYMGPSAEVQRSYQNGDKQAGIYIAYYRGQQQDAELINSQNVMVIQKHPVWRQVAQHRVSIPLHGATRSVIETQLKSNQQHLLIWHWYWVGGIYTSSPYEAKIREALTRLMRGRRDGAGLVVYVPVAEKVETARETLQEFVDDMLPAMEKSLGAMEMGLARPAG